MAGVFRRRHHAYRRRQVPAGVPGVYTLPLDAGSYTLTGQDVTFVVTRVIPLDAGSYTLTGQDPTLVKLLVMTVDAGSYTLTGQDVTFVVTRILALDAGSYTLTGQDPTIVKVILLTLDAGSYTLTGQDPTLLVSRVLGLDAGSYTLTGQTTSLLRQFLLGLDAGSYTLTGQDPSLTAGRVIDLDAGSYTLTGLDPTITSDAATYELVCDAGSYTMTLNTQIMVYGWGERSRVNVGHIQLNGREYVVEMAGYNQRLTNQLAAKIGQGQGDYGDLSDWSGWLMTDWRGGTNAAEPDEGGYLYGEADTRFPRQIILPPKMTFTAVGDNKLDTGDSTLRDYAIADTPVIAHKFTATASRTNPVLHAYLPTDKNIVARLYADSAGTLGSLLATSPAFAFSAGTSGREDYNWRQTRFTYSFVGSTDYWIAIVPQEDCSLWTVTVSEGYDSAAASPYDADYAVPWVLNLEEVKDASSNFNEIKVIVKAHNDAIYCGIDTDIYRYASGNWVSVTTLSAGILDVETWGGATYWVLSGADVQKMTGTAGSESFAAETNRQGTHIASWNGYLYLGDSNGQIEYTNGTTWTAVSETLPGAITGMAGMGAVSMYCSTAEGLYYLGPSDIWYGVTGYDSRDGNNGYGMIHWQGSIYVPVGPSLYRVTLTGTEHQILSMGLDQDEGLPSEFAGQIIALAGYNARLLALVYPLDYETNTARYASLWQWDGTAWHPLAQGGSGTSTSNFIHPGKASICLDRQGSQIFWTHEDGLIPRTIATLHETNPINSPNYTYMPCAWIEFPVFDASLREVTKDFESVYIAGENFNATSGTQRRVRVYWQDDDSWGTWQELGVITADTQELRWDDNTTRPQTKRFKLALRLETEDESETPVIEAVRVKFMAMTKDRYQWFLPIRLADYLEMTDDSLDNTPVGTQWTQLNTAITATAPIRYRDIDRNWYDVKVLDANRRVAKWETYNINSADHSYEIIAQVTLLEINQVANVEEEVQALGILSEGNEFLLGG